MRPSYSADTLTRATPDCPGVVFLFAKKYFTKSFAANQKRFTFGVSLTPNGTKKETMKNVTIIAAIKNNEGRTHEIEQAFQNADKKHNFSYLFGKTQDYWSNRQWNAVARIVKSEM